MSSLAERALRLAIDGFRVLPLKPNGKWPLTRHGVKDASADCGVVTAWWGRWPDANVGVATGRGWFVVDIDIRAAVDGEATWAGIQRVHGEGPTTRAVITPSGGRHLYFATDAKVACSVGKLGQGIDVRGIGGYAVAAGVIDGRQYETLAEPIAPAPCWLLELVGERTVTRRPTAEWQAVACGGAELGHRNNTLASLAGHLLWQGVDPGVVLELLRGWNQGRCHPPLPDHEVVRCVGSIAARELRRRGGLRS